MNGLGEVHIVSREGPEWSDRLEVWSDLNTAHRRADYLNKTKNRNDPMERMSVYVVVTYEVDPEDS